MGDSPVVLDVLLVADDVGVDALEGFDREVEWMAFSLDALSVLVPLFEYGALLGTPVPGWEDKHSFI